MTCDLNCHVRLNYLNWLELGLVITDLTWIRLDLFVLEWTWDLHSRDLLPYLVNALLNQASHDYVSNQNFSPNKYFVASGLLLLTIKWKRKHLPRRPYSQHTGRNLSPKIGLSFPARDFTHCLYANSVCFRVCYHLWLPANNTFKIH